MFEIIVFLPLVGFLIAGLFGKFIGDRASEVITTSFVVLCAVLSWIGFFTSGGREVNINIIPWLQIADLNFSWSLYIDHLSSIMLIVVCSISALVHLYSIGYMHSDKSRARFFAYISLFTFMMLMLVTANNLLQLFFGWEGVGLVSYLLIGFWFTRDSANKAAIKAFIVNRVGDFAFLIGVFSLYSIFNTVIFKDIFLKLQQLDYVTLIPYSHWSISTQAALNVTCFMLFIGAMGKSAQFLLHVWLPDAMEGPTPVSALIHAATMVTAGVFLVCRMQPLFEHTPIVASFIIIIGALSAFFAATVGLVQNDIKRVIAYSTCSQLGYMFVALGVGAYDVGMYHLFTHAFFKALLFLGAGSVIHAISDEQDMRKMGGLFKHIPATYIAMLIGTFSLTGLGIPETFIGTSGFFSKDAIIEATYTSTNVIAPFAFWVLIIVALFTSFYSWRLIFMTFHGKPKASVETMHNIHESGWLILIPLFILSAGALFFGFLFKDYFINVVYILPNIVKLLPFFAMVLGFILAYWFYILMPSIPGILSKKLSILYMFLLNKWYIDELYNYIFVKPIFKLGSFLYKNWDLSIIERLGPIGVSTFIFSVTNRVVRFQTGFVYHYAFVIIAGIVAFLTWAMIGSFM